VTSVSGRGGAGFGVGERGIRLPAGYDEGLSVSIDGHRVWSFSADEPRTATRNGELVPWPAPLKRRLNGVATFALHTIAEDHQVLSEEVKLGDADERIAVTDGKGRWLAIDKGGRLSRMFDGASRAKRRAVVEAAQRAIDELTEAGVPSFLAFGCLLGAVREGRLIAHDSDADVAYLATATHPFDVIAESLRLERQMLAKGWRTRRLSGADFKLFFDHDDGTTIGIDVFGAFYHDDSFFLMPSVQGDLPRSSILPVGKVMLEGVEVTAPADPEALLEITYGPHWRVPDPSFKFAPSLSTRRFLAGHMRGERRHQKYWDTFYRNQADRVSREPSPFAEWVAAREPDRGELIDIGSGTGRDSLWFSSQGFTTLGCDYSQAGVHYASAQARKRGLSAEFEHLNLYDLRHVVVKGARFAHERSTDVVYARFLVHAMEDYGRQLLWTLSRSALRRTKGRLYLEFRTEATEHEFGEHYRQFVQPDVVEAELQSHGFAIEHSENRHGLAVHKSEDPRVCRIVAKMR